MFLDESVWEDPVVPQTGGSTCIRLWLFDDPKKSIQDLIDETGSISYHNGTVLTIATGYMRGHSVQINLQKMCKGRLNKYPELFLLDLDVYNKNKDKDFRFWERLYFEKVFKFIQPANFEAFVASAFIEGVRLGEDLQKKRVFEALGVERLRF